MILAKCCHDLDILLWMMADQPITRLHSFGSLLYFGPAHKPPGAPPRCTDGCPVAEECAFYAPRLYLTENVGWPTSAISVDPSYEARLHALQTGPYGRCVYQCDNDVVDHQVVTMEHANGALTTLVMHGHSQKEGRTMRYDGTRATLRASAVHGQEPEITLYDHRHETVERIPIPRLDDEYGHGGGDAGVMRAFIAAIQNPGGPVLTGVRASLESHLLAFAAEESRASGAAVDMAAYRARVEGGG
jgi:predicted dehydrogenase